MHLPSVRPPRDARPKLDKVELRDLVRDGQAKIIRIQLKAKFGKLPKWVDERLVLRPPGTVR